jgi:hypothetical protein
MSGLLAMVILSSCSIIAQDTSPSNSQTDEITFDVTFDENYNCIVSGPTEVPTGDYLISLNNLSDIKVDLAVNHLIDDHTYQDLLDLQNEPGEPFNKVYWISHSLYFL